MQKKFEMSSMGEMNFFLGLQVNQLPTSIFIHQTKYVNDLLSWFKMVDAKPATTPLLLNHGIGPDERGDSVDPTLYRSMIGSLMYLTAMRPDIMYATCLCARYQSQRKVSHLIAVKRILCYLKAYPNTGLWYPRDDDFKLLAFSDSDYGSCKLNAKSTTAGCQFFGTRLVHLAVRQSTLLHLAAAHRFYGFNRK